MPKPGLKLMQIMKAIPWRGERNIEELTAFAALSEDALQLVVFKYLESQYPKVLAFAIPNGSHKSVQQRLLFQLTGLKPGVSDIFLAMPNAEYSGLFLELKNGNAGRLSPEQQTFLDQAQGAGYQVAVCRSLFQVMNTVDNYLKTASI